jgi:hypothetical protein
MNNIKFKLNFQIIVNYPIAPSIEHGPSLGASFAKIANCGHQICGLFACRIVPLAPEWAIVHHSDTVARIHRLPNGPWVLASAADRIAKIQRASVGPGGTGDGASRIPGHLHANPKAVVHSIRIYGIYHQI